MILVNTVMTLVGWQAYLLEKETNINIRETLLNNPVVEMQKTKVYEPDSNNKQLEQEVGENKINAQSMGKGVSKELKHRLNAYHANDKAKQKYGWDNRETI